MPDASLVDRVLEDAAAQAPSHDPTVIDLIAKAHRYLAFLTDGTGKSLTDIARQYRTELSEVSRLLPLAFLSPKIMQSIFAGTQPVDLTAQRLSRITNMSIGWKDQAGLLGF